MKILLATIFSLPSVGGLNTYVEMLKKGLEAKGHSVDILARQPKTNRYYLVGSNESIPIATIENEIRKPLNRVYMRHSLQVDRAIQQKEMARYVFELASASFKLSQYDLIHSQDIVSTRALARVKPNRTPLIMTIHGSMSREIRNFRKHLGANIPDWRYVVKAEELGIQSADEAIVLTQWMKRILSESGIPVQQLRVIANGMDVPAFIQKMNCEPSPPAKGNPDHFTIVCPARLTPEKDHKTLIDALGQLSKQRSDFACWMIGDGALRSELESYCSRQNVESHIQFLGYRNDVPALLRQADLVVLPSQQENLPFAIMEGQIAGKAVIASNAGGMPEMIQHRHNGLIFQKGNATQLTSLITQLMKNDDLRTKLGTDAASFGKNHWSSAIFCTRMIDIYNQAIKAVQSNTEKQYTMTSMNHIFGYKTAHPRHIKPVWKKIIQHLPNDYMIPDPAFTQYLLVKAGKHHS